MKLTVTKKNKILTSTKHTPRQQTNKQTKQTKTKNKIARK